MNNFSIKNGNTRKESRRAMQSVLYCMCGRFLVEDKAKKKRKTYNCRQFAWRLAELTEVNGPGGDVATQLTGFSTIP